MNRASGRLIVVATPIGNMGDMTARAREALASADIIAAEDTRHTGQMLRLLGIDRPLLSLHEHNEAQRSTQVLARLAHGELVALVSDAGMPLVSDPGYVLVRAVIEAGYSVSAVPGPSAVTLALGVSGLPTDRWCFEGFLPARGGERAARIAALARETRTVVMFESPHRILVLLEELARSCGEERLAVVCRELTKAFETIYRGTLATMQDIAAKDANFARGEITLVLAGAAAADAAAGTALSVERVLDVLLPELPPARAAAVAAQLCGMRRADVYALVLKRG